MTWSTCGSFCRHADFRFTIREIPSYRPIGSVAAQLFIRRWPLYALTCALVFGAELLFYTFVHVRLANFYAELIGSPIISVIVMVNVGADATGTLERTRERIERILERAWAIIVIDAGAALVMKASLDAMTTSDALTAFFGVMVLFIVAMLVYAEPFAALETQVQMATIIPFAVMRSMMLAWVNISRIFSLFAIEIALSIAELFLLRGLGASGQHLLDVVDLAYIAAVNAPLAALFAVAYLDTAAQERRRLR